MKRILLFLLAAMLCQGAFCGVDAKFMSQSAEKVWNTRPDLFDARRSIPDSISQNESAVVIGSYDYIDADYLMTNGMLGTETESECVSFTRKMVKLLDRAAVENFSKHEFGFSERVGARFWQSIVESDNAFGARIYKPDGSVIDVDVSKAYDIDEGKKGDGKNVIKRIIDIPGLEPGDVLEYFTLTRYRARELDLPVFRVSVSDEYPVMEAVVEGSFDPDLTVEFRGYNGVPKLETGKNGKDNTVWIHLKDIPKMSDKQYLNRWREIPFYDFFILNNTSPYRFYPKYSRAGGIFQDLPAGTIFRDISLVMAASTYDKSSLPGKIRGIIKKYRKAHPEATAKELIDMAWIATNYANAVGKDDDVSDFWLSLIFSDILKKENLSDSASVAFLTPATEVATTEIINWREPDFGALVGDSLFLPGTLRSFLPGELPGVYQGQTCAAYPGDREKLWDFTMPRVLTTPVSKSGDNKLLVNAVVTMGDDNDATIDNELICSGAMKIVSTPFVDDADWISAQEEYLGIEPNKRYKDKSRDPEAREKELDQFAEELYGSFYSGEDAKISDVEVASLGIVPSSPDFKLRFKSHIPDFTARAGNDIIVRIGKLAGNNDKIDGVQRNRSTNIYFNAAFQENYTITLNIPEGYAVDEKSLEAMACNVQTPAGKYISGVKVSPDGRTLTLAVRLRILRPYLDKAAWPVVLELIDAASAFSDARLVLRKI